MDKNAGKKLAEEHWENYVKELLEACGVSPELVEMIRFHYVSAFAHGYKHGREVKNEDSS